MKAHTIFDLGDQDKPEHADHHANLRLQKTAAYAALENINNQHLSQTEAADFIEDWLANITLNDNITPAKALTAIRSIVINQSASSEHSESNFGREQSVAEKIAAEAKKWHTARNTYFYLWALPQLTRD